MSTEDRSLVSRMNQMQSDNEQIAQTIEEVDSTQTSLDFGEEPVIATQSEEPVFVDTEPTQVAGLNPMKILNFLKKDVDPALAKRSEKMKGSDEYVIIPNATEADFDAVMSKRQINLLQLSQEMLNTRMARRRKQKTMVSLMSTLLKMLMELNSLSML